MLYTTVSYQVIISKENRNAMMNLHEHQALLHEEISSPFRTSMFEILQEAQLASPSSLSPDMHDDHVFNSYQDNCIDNASTTSTSTIINNCASAMFEESSMINIDIEDTIDLSGIIMQKEIIPNLDDVVVENPIDPLVFEASIFYEDCLSSVPPASTMVGESDNPPWSMASPMLSAANRGTFLDDASSFMGYESILQPLDFQSHHNAVLYCPDSMCSAFDPQDLQGVSGERQEQLVGGIGECRSLVSSELISTSLEDSGFKVGKLSPEERKEKIDRYIHKRNHRNFTKKIKYACRKTLADSRPRVRGRFAKNVACREEEYINIEEVTVNVKEEEDDMVDYCSYIFAGHAAAAGVNGFEYNYNQIQSWI